MPPNPVRNAGVDRPDGGSGVSELHHRSIARLAADLRAGAVTARELLDHYLERIERLNPAVNAFVYVDPEAAKAAQASDARLKAGRPLGPLDGIPVSVKDNLLVRGCPAVWGSPLYADYVPDHDELPVARLRAAGAVLLGKTNTPEFSLRGFTDNPVFGPTRNPWNLVLTPGGSSGGAAAAVAAGLCPIALGTDGGGSIRRPAAHTGLVGFKPGLGRIERGDGFPPLMFDCEVVGPLARSTADTRLMFDILAAHGRTSPRRGPLRILVVERFGDAPVEPMLAARCRQVAVDLKVLGHAVTFGALPFEIDDAMLAWQALTSASLAWLAEQEPRFLESASSEYVDQARGGSTLTGADYVALTQTLFDFRTVAAPRLPRHGHHHDALHGGTALARRSTLSAGDRRTEGGSARACSLHRLGQRLRPSRHRSPGAPGRRRVADRGATRRRAGGRRGAVRPGGGLRGRPPMGLSLASLGGLTAARMRSDRK